MDHINIMANLVPCRVAMTSQARMADLAISTAAISLCLPLSSHSRPIIRTSPWLQSASAWQEWEDCRPHKPCLRPARSVSSGGNDGHPTSPVQLYHNFSLLLASPAGCYRPFSPVILIPLPVLSSKLRRFSCLCSPKVMTASEILTEHKVSCFCYRNGKFLTVFC